MKDRLIILNNKTEIEKDHKRAIITRVYQFLSDLEYEYPGFGRWYSDRVVDGLSDGSRTMILDIDSDQLRGVAILKMTLEKKICTLRVQPTYRQNGIGQLLLEKSLQVLQTRYPLITVSSRRLNQFLPLLNKFDFLLSEAHPGYYNRELIEYAFNGALERQYLLTESCALFDSSLALR